MMLRIIHGKLKPGTWDAPTRILPRLKPFFSGDYATTAARSGSLKNLISKPP